MHLSEGNVLIGVGRLYGVPAGPLEGMPRRYFGFALLHRNDSDFNQISSNNETAN